MSNKRAQTPEQMRNIEHALSKKTGSADIRQSHTFLIHAAIVLFFLSILIPFAAIPPLRFGYYAQIEGIAVALWLCGGLGALWNGMLFGTRPTLARQLWSLPVVWTGLFLALVAAIRSLFMPTPLLSWIGSPQLIEGIFSFLSLVFLSPPFLLLFKQQILRKTIFFTVLIAGTALAIPAILGAMDSEFSAYHFWEWAPLFFSDFTAILAPVFFVVGAYYKHLFKTPAARCAQYGLCSILIAGLIWYSKNKSLEIGIWIAGGAYLILKCRSHYY